MWNYWMKVSVMFPNDSEVYEFMFVSENIFLIAVFSPELLFLFCGKRKWKQMYRRIQFLILCSQIQTQRHRKSHIMFLNQQNLPHSALKTNVRSCS